MDGDDWNRCPEQVFEIFGVDYRTGPIYVGDKIALHIIEPAAVDEGFYTFSMSGESGHVDSCEDSLEAFLFSRKCRRHVFQIYAKGRDMDDTIFEHDHIILVHDNQRPPGYFYNPAYVDFSSWSATFSPCKAEWELPLQETYDTCPGVVVELWQQ